MLQSARVDTLHINGSGWREEAARIVWRVRCGRLAYDVPAMWAVNNVAMFALLFISWCSKQQALTYIVLANLIALADYLIKQGVITRFFRRERFIEALLAGPEAFDATAARYDGPAAEAAPTADQRASALDELARRACQAAYRGSAAQWLSYFRYATMVLGGMAGIWMWLLRFNTAQIKLIDLKYAHQQHCDVIVWGILCLVFLSHSDSFPALFAMRVKRELHRVLDPRYVRAVNNFSLFNLHDGLLAARRKVQSGSSGCGMWLWLWVAMEAIRLLNGSSFPVSRWVSLATLVVFAATLLVRHWELRNLQRSYHRLLTDAGLGEHAVRILTAPLPPPQRLEAWPLINTAESDYISERLSDYAKDLGNRLPRAEHTAAKVRLGLYLSTAAVCLSAGYAYTALRLRFMCLDLKVMLVYLAIDLFIILVAIIEMNHVARETALYSWLIEYESGGNQL